MPAERSVKSTATRSRKLYERPTKGRSGSCKFFPYLDYKQAWGYSQKAGFEVRFSQYGESNSGAARELQRAVTERKYTVHARFYPRNPSNNGKTFYLVVRNIYGSDTTTHDGYERIDVEALARLIRTSEIQAAAYDSAGIKEPHTRFPLTHLQLATALNKYPLLGQRIKAFEAAWPQPDIGHLFPESRMYLRARTATPELADGEQPASVFKRSKIGTYTIHRDVRMRTQSPEAPEAPIAAPAVAPPAPPAPPAPLAAAVAEIDNFPAPGEEDVMMWGQSSDEEGPGGMRLWAGTSKLRRMWMVTGATVAMRARARMSVVAALAANADLGDGEDSDSEDEAVNVAVAGQPAPAVAPLAVSHPLAPAAAPSPAPQTSLAVAPTTAPAVVPSNVASGSTQAQTDDDDDYDDDDESDGGEADDESSEAGDDIPSVPHKAVASTEEEEEQLNE